MKTNFSKPSLFLFQYKPKTLNLAALYLSYGLTKGKIPFQLKLFLQFKTPLCLNTLIDFFKTPSKILAIGCWSDVLPYLLVALRRFKKQFPDKIIILGGIGPSTAGKEILREFPCIDFVIQGCGVDPLPKLIRKIQENDSDLRDIKGLVYRSNKKSIVINKQNFYSASLLQTTIPLHRLVNVERIRWFTFATSFGCPYSCSFCQMPCLSARKVVYRDLDCVVREIALIAREKKNKPFEINIIDEAFLLDRNRLYRFFQLLKRKKLKLNISCYGRVNCVNEPLLKAMANGGVSDIYFGIESGSNRILKRIRKGFTIEEAKQALLLTKKYIKNVNASFVFFFHLKPSRT